MNKGVRKKYQLKRKKRKRLEEKIRGGQRYLYNWG